MIDNLHRMLISETINCLTGEILEAFRRFSLFKYFKTKDCNDCDKCRELCDLETRPSEANCTNCWAYSNICPVDAIKVGWKGDT